MTRAGLGGKTGTDAGQKRQGTGDTLSASVPPLLPVQLPKPPCSQRDPRPHTNVFKGHPHCAVRTYVPTYLRTCATRRPFPTLNEMLVMTKQEPPSAIGRLLNAGHKATPQSFLRRRGGSLDVRLHVFIMVDFNLLSNFYDLFLGPKMRGGEGCV